MPAVFSVTVGICVESETPAEAWYPTTQRARENKDQRENFNIFETSKDNEWFYNKIGLAQREILSVILGLLRELEP
jgi:hypothetical protein